MRPPDAAELFHRHHLVVFRFLRRMTGSASVAEDLTQDVFLRVVRGIGEYEERSREVSWIFRIARNVLIDRHRAQAGAPASIELDDAMLAPMRPAQMLGVALDEALSRLGPEDREAFLMREVVGLGYRDIAEATGVTPDAVRMRIYRARAALRRELGPSVHAAEKGMKELSR
jgi:RNA polymerase sigma-70 factor, ECF subfamily